MLQRLRVLFWIRIDRMVKESHFLDKQEHLEHVWSPCQERTYRNKEVGYARVYQLRARLTCLIRSFQ